MSESESTTSSPAPDTAVRDTTGPRISAQHTSPDRLVLTEDGNTDGWLASDTSVSLDTTR